MRRNVVFELNHINCGLFVLVGWRWAIYSMHACPERARKESVTRKSWIDCWICTVVVEYGTLIGDESTRPIRRSCDPRTGSILGAAISLLWQRRPYNDAECYVSSRHTRVVQERCRATIPRTTSCSQLVGGTSLSTSKPEYASKNDLLIVPLAGENMKANVNKAWNGLRIRPASFENAAQRHVCESLPRE